MTPRQLKTGCFLLEGLNQFACIYYFNYLLFHLRDRFGFGNLGNLTVAATCGFVYTFASWWCGRFAQRHGCFRALKIGFAGMTLVLVVGSFLDSVAGQYLTLIGWTVTVCFTWPALEALVSENKAGDALPRMVGIYNVVWAASAAAANFAGGALYEHFGARSIFWLPAGMFAAQWLLTLWLSTHAEANATNTPAAVAENPAPASEAPKHAPTFLRLAWLANPFAYIAINTVTAIIPQLAHTLGLSPTQAGFFCSIWMFLRLGAFIFLWRWTGWHYRFGWLLAAFLALIGSFIALMVSHSFLWLMLGQTAFGLAIGLLYYSSLFYSMDAGDEKSAHGGMHEAAIGLGIFLGPALGALSLWRFPAYPNGSAWAVSGLLVIGLGLLFKIRNGKTSRK